MGEAETDSRFDLGLDRFIEVTGEEGSETLAGLAEIAPDLGRYIVEFGYGDIYSRPGLALRERQIATLGALTALGGVEPQLETHVAGALRLGLTPAEVVEAVVQCLPFAGFPRVLNAIAVVRRVFERRGVEVEAEPR
jgi:4-carboxymuconolactone decarboxylase